MTEPKHEESFKVVDRRLFSEDGEMRKDVAEQTDREHAVADAIAAKAAKAAQPAAPAGQKAGTPDGNAASAQASGNNRKSNHSFQMLVDFIARNAAMLLGGYTDPRTNQPLLDLDGAREIIDMLDALRDTTQGNLALEDDRLLTEVLGSLKMSFLEISKAAETAMKEKAKARP